MVPLSGRSSLIAPSSHTDALPGTGGDPPETGGARHTGRRLSPHSPTWAERHILQRMSTQTQTRHVGLVTSLSWIPTEAIEGAQRLAFDSGITHYDDPPPDEGIDLAALREADRFRFANELRAFITVDDSRTDRRLRVPGGRRHGIDAREPAGGEAPVPGVPAARHPARARARRRLGPLRPDLWWPHGHAGAAAGAPQALRAVAGATGLDDAFAHPPCRRPRRVRAHRCQPLPPALGLRRRQPALAQVRAHRLQGLVPQVVRQAQSLGATRTPKRSSPRWSPRWRPRCPPSSCRAVAGVASTSSRPAPSW